MNDALSRSERTPPLHIAVCGGGLAGAMTTAALAAQLPTGVRLTQVGSAPLATDFWYGGSTGATAYSFNLSAQVSEPRLLLESETTFFFGTHFSEWGRERRAWVQALHLALPVMAGVGFHHFLRSSRLNSLEPFLISAVAGAMGRFAHPPEDQGSPLSRAEYGYQFEPDGYGALFRAAAGEATLIRGEIADVLVSDGRIEGVRTTDGAEVAADLFVDCTGPEAILLSRLGVEAPRGRLVQGAWSAAPAPPGPPLRRVTGREFGWQATTHLTDREIALTACDPSSAAAAIAAHSSSLCGSSLFTIGARAEAWRANCVAIGHAAGILEPLTPAPMILIEREIERLLSLIPVSPDMRIERREFNRRHRDDHRHAAAFHRTLFAIEDAWNTPFWRAACEEPIEEDLARKLHQFAERGALVRYDLEPFHDEDWTILHWGMGRRPVRYDRLADAVPSEQAEATLRAMSRSIADLVKKMPPHGRYLSGLRDYLRKER